jgi:hypothetical protein
MEIFIFINISERPLPATGVAVLRMAKVRDLYGALVHRASPMLRDFAGFLVDRVSLFIYLSFLLQQFDNVTVRVSNSK